MNKLQRQELMQILIVCIFVLGFVLVSNTFTGMAGSDFSIMASEPVVNLVWPIINGTNITYYTVNLTYNVSDDSGVVNCSLFIDNEINNSDSSITKDANQTFNITFDDGNYLWNVQCEDDLGNLGNSSQYNFTVDVLRSDINSNSTLISEWKSFGKTLDGTRYYNDSVNIGKFGLLWYYDAGSSVEASPSIENGIAYFGINGLTKGFYALNVTDGAHYWNYSINSGVHSSNAIANGSVYFGHGASVFYSLNASNGNHNWNYTTSAYIYSSPIVLGGKVYFGSGTNVYALNAITGKQIWNYKVGDTITSSLCISNDIVYIGSHDDKFYALNTTDGSHIWNYTTGGNVPYTTPSVKKDIVYFGSWDDNFYALNATNGTLIWSHTTGGNVESGSSVVDGVVYFGSRDNKVYAMNASDGTHIWNYTTGGWVYSTPAVTSNGILFVGSYDDNIYALNTTDGSYIWNYTTGGNVWSSPSIVDGVVYVGSFDSKLYAFGVDTTNPEVSLVWPGNNTNLTYSGINLTYNVTDLNNIVNCSLFINNDIYNSTSLVSKNINQTFNISLSDGSYLWNVQCEDIGENKANSTQYNFTISIPVEEGGQGEQAPSSGGITIPAPVTEEAEEPTEKAEEPTEKSEEPTEKSESKTEEDILNKQKAKELINKLEFENPELEVLISPIALSIVKSDVKIEYVGVDLSDEGIVIDLGGKGSLNIDFEDSKPKFSFNLFGNGEGHLEEPKRKEFFIHLIVFVLGLLITGFLLRKKIRRFYKLLIKKK